MNAHQAVRQGERNPPSERNGGMLYPLLLVAAIAIIVFSIIGIATMTGILPNAVNRDGAVRPSATHEQTDGRPARIEAPSRERVPQPGNPRSAMVLPAWYA